MTESIIDELLRVSAVTAVVGPRIALVQLPQGSDYPAITYSPITDTAMQPLCGPSVATSARVQINPLAESMTAVNAIHALVKTAMQSDQTRTIAGKSLRYCRFIGYGPLSKDDFSGMWTKPADYMLMYE